MEEEKFRPSPEVKATSLQVDYGIEGEKFSLHRVTAGREDVGIYYVSKSKSQHSSFNWSAKVDFQSVEKSVTELGHVLLGKPIEFRNPDKFRIVAEVASRGIYKSNNAISFRTEPAKKYAIHNVQEYINYRKHMLSSDPISVSKVHYDILNTENDMAVSLQIGNSQLPGNHYASIRLFTNEPWTEELTGWMLKHHEKEDVFLRNGVKSSHISKVLSALSR